MKPLKSFPLFVDTIHVMVDKQMSDGASTVLVTEVPPGGGPPPHTHTMEDEIFAALEGEFEETHWQRESTEPAAFREPTGDNR